jgi:hypothetical protein
MPMALLGVALFAAVLSRGAGRTALVRTPPEDVPRLTPPAAGLVEPLPEPPARDLFRYEEPVRPTIATNPPRGAGREAPLAAPTPTPLPVRLVGFVRKPDGLRAALASVAGVFLVAPGDTIEGLLVLGIDEDRGVRLRAADGRELSLQSPE